jgi:hypothetical protein
MIPEPPISGASLSKEQLIEWGILLFLYFVGPAIGRYVKRKQQEQSERTGGGGGVTPAAEAEGAPMAAVPRPQPAARAATPEPPDSSVLPALREAIADWHAAVAPRHGRETARRLEAAVEGRIPSLATGQLLSEASTKDARDLTAQVQRLTRAVRRLRTPEQRVLGRAVDGLLSPLVTATEGPGGRSMLLLVGAEPDAASDRLAESASLVLIPVGSGEPSAARFFTELIGATERVLRRQPDRLQAVLEVAWSSLVTKVRAGGPAAAALADALTDPMAAQMLVETTAAAVVSRRIAPLGWVAMGVPAGETFQPRTPAQAVLQRAALGSSLVRDAMQVELEAGRVSAIIAEAIEDALARSPWEGETGQALATLVGSWGPAEDAAVTEIMESAASGGPVGGGLDHGHGAAALVALALMGRGGAAPQAAVIAVDAAGGGDGDKPRGRAAQTAGGAQAQVAYTRPQQVPYRQRGGTPRPGDGVLHVEGAPDPVAVEVLALQILLGPPRARRHPAFAGGPRSMWARPTPRRALGASG